MSMITKTAVKAIIKQLPKDRVNPFRVNNGVTSCLYTDPIDPSKHCIAGEVLVQLGHGDLLTEDWVENTPVDTIIDGLATPQATRFLTALQRAADGIDQGNTPRLGPITTSAPTMSVFGIGSGG